MRKIILPGILFCAAVVVGFSTMKSSWEGVSYYNVANISSQRDPAAMNQVYDFSHLKGEALQFASKDRLLNGASLIQEGNEVGIQLGHFVVSGPEGHKRYACHAFDKVILGFVAEDFAVNGQRALMEVQGSCIVTQDGNQIDPIHIPFSDLLQENPTDGEHTYYGERPVTIRVESLFGQWPKAWALRTVRLFNSENKTEIRASVQELPQDKIQKLRFSLQQ